MTDARLLGPAVAAWIGAALALAVVSSAPTVVARHAVAMRGIVVLGGILAALAVVGLAEAVRGARAAVEPRVPIRRVAVVLCGFVTAGAAAAAVNTLLLTPLPVAGWVDARATAQARVVVAGEPQRRVPQAASWPSPAWMQVRAITESIAARGAVVDIAAPLLLRLADGAHVPPPGSVVTVMGRLSPMPVGSDLLAGLAVSGTPVTVAPAGPLDSAAHAMRSGLSASLRGRPPAAAALVAGLAIGDESAQPPQLTSDMRASGLSHLTAVSGGNVAIVLAVVLVVAAALRLALWSRILAALAALAYFVLLVGPQPSVLRAAVMGAVTVIGVLVGGRRGGPSVLGGAVLGLVLVMPALAVSWGFALSVLATAGILLVAPRLQQRLEAWPLTARWPPVLTGAAALTLAAQLATLPVLVAMGASVGWASVPANLAAMPAVAPVTVLGLAAAAVSPLAPAVATILATAASGPAAWIALVAQMAAHLPMSTVPTPGGWTGLAALSVVSGTAGVAWWGWRTRIGPGVPRGLRAAIAVTTGVAVVIVLARPPASRGWPPADWLMIMCDVGQGDALLLRSGPGQAVVVDVGPDPAPVARCLDEAGVDTVPAIVLTHFHADHVRGLSGVLDGWPVGEVLTSPVRDPEVEAVTVDDLLATHGLSAQTMTAGDVRAVGDVRWRSLWPRRRIASGSIPNNASVVLDVDIRGRHLLLSGDIEPEAQTAIAADLRAAHVDVVKVPHHGSRHQADAFPSWARAAVALISVGADNDYGHPAGETIAAWEALGAVVARTDRDGDIAVVATAAGVGLVTRRGMLPSP